MNQSTAQRGEIYVRIRSIAAITFSTLLMATQGLRMNGNDSLLNWALWGVAVFMFLIWAGGAFSSRKLRDIINDENTVLHRRKSFMTGFWVMIATAVTCLILTYFRDFGPRDAIQIILTAGFSSSLLSFGVAELNAASPTRPCGKY